MSEMWFGACGKHSRQLLKCTVSSLQSSSHLVRILTSALRCLRSLHALLYSIYVYKALKSSRRTLDTMGIPWGTTSGFQRAIQWGSTRHRLKHLLQSLKGVLTSGGEGLGSEWSRGSFGVCCGIGQKLLGSVGSHSLINAGVFKGIEERLKKQFVCYFGAFIVDVV